MIDATFRLKKMEGNLDYDKDLCSVDGNSHAKRWKYIIDLFSNLYDGKSLKIDSWHPQTIRGRIAIVVCLKTHNVKKDSISFPIHFCH